MTSHEHAHDPAQPHSAQEWDDRYGSAERVWTDNVNPSLIVEVEAAHAGGLTPGTALDVGSGEGADARWLAARGWAVTALDISVVALERARGLAAVHEVQSAADTAPGAIDWVCADLTDDPVPAGPYDLVALHYFPILKTNAGVVDKLIDAVAPGGTLLVVAHALDGVRAHGFDPDDYIQPADFRARIPEWAIAVDETRPRGIAAGGGHHVDDIVLRAHRPR